MYENFNNQNNGQNEGGQNTPHPPQPNYLINPHNGKPYDANNMYDTNNPFSPLYQKHQQPGLGFATASLVLGILAMILPIPVIDVILGILGLIFAFIAPSKGCHGGIQTAGLVLSIIGTLNAVLFTFMVLIGGFNSIFF
ncbi:MAG: DUF4190 domain-containing protein [Oscillospiraceae bacterium]|nr:DUF4190 domain-containing protein [Oscillospiraceae bacterium]